MSSRTIWTRTPPRRRGALPPVDVVRRLRPRAIRGSRWWPSRAGTGRRRSGSGRAHENSLPSTMNTGCGQPDDPRDRQQQQRCASPWPGRGRSYRARSRDSAGSRWTRIEMKMTLSMPRTISRTVSVSEGDPGLGVGQQFHRARGTGRRVRCSCVPWPRRDRRHATRRARLPDARRRSTSGRRRRPSARAGRPGRRAARRVPARGPGAAALPRLDARLPDEPERLGGDGRAAAGGRAARRRAVDGDGRPHRHQHLRDPRGRRAEGHRPAGPARRGSRPPTRRCAWS